MFVFVDQGLIIKWHSGRRRQGSSSARTTALRPVLEPSRSHSYALVTGSHLLGVKLITNTTNTAIWHRGQERVELCTISLYVFMV
jgi:hypothetical protein